MLVALLKVYINRTMGNGNKSFNEKVINFYSFVQIFSLRAAEVVYENLKLMVNVGCGGLIIVRYRIACLTSHMTC